MNDTTENEYNIEITGDYQITIDGETYDVSKVKPSLSYGGLPAVECYGVQFYVARDSEHAGEAVKQYYRDIINTDPNKFVCLVGAENLIAWGMGRWAKNVKNLNNWLDEIVAYPENTWGTHDGTEYEITQVSQDIVDDLGWVPSVAYRCG